MTTNKSFNPTGNLPADLANRAAALGMRVKDHCNGCARADPAGSGLRDGLRDREK